MTSTCKCCAETNFKNKESQYRDETENYSDCDVYLLQKVCIFGKVLGSFSILRQLFYGFWVHM